jgi:hypothetical protein
MRINQTPRLSRNVPSSVGLFRPAIIRALVPARNTNTGAQKCVIQRVANNAKPTFGSCVGSSMELPRQSRTWSRAMITMTRPRSMSIEVSRYARRSDPATGRSATSAMRVPLRFGSSMLRLAPALGKTWGVSRARSKAECRLYVCVFLG